LRAYAFSGASGSSVSSRNAPAERHEPSGSQSSLYDTQLKSTSVAAGRLFLSPTPSAAFAGDRHQHFGIRRPEDRLRAAVELSFPRISFLLRTELAVLPSIGFPQSAARKIRLRATGPASPVPPHGRTPRRPPPRIRTRLPEADRCVRRICLAPRGRLPPTRARKFAGSHQPGTYHDDVR
jgi:hypothetical protein